MYVVVCFWGLTWPTDLRHSRWVVRCYETLIFKHQRMTTTIQNRDRQSHASWTLVQAWTLAWASANINRSRNHDLHWRQVLYKEVLWPYVTMLLIQTVCRHCRLPKQAVGAWNILFDRSSPMTWPLTTSSCRSRVLRTPGQARMGYYPLERPKYGYFASDCSQTVCSLNFRKGTTRAMTSLIIFGQ